MLDSDSPQSDDPRTGGPAIAPPDGDPHPVDTVISLDGLQLTIVRATLGTTVQLVGELDLTNASEVWRELEQVVSATPGDLTLDLAELAFVDSRGLSVLIRLAQRLQPAGTLRLVAVPPRVAETIQVAGIGKLFSFR